MSRTTSHPMRPLLVIHVLFVVLIAAWWGAYFWRHTPARRVYRMATVSSRAAGHEPGFISFDPIFAGLKVAIGDVALGALSLGFLALGTHVYARRVQIWLDARTSGQAVTFGTTDLESQALSANASKGITP